LCTAAQQKPKRGTRANPCCLFCSATGGATIHHIAFSTRTFSFLLVITRICPSRRPRCRHRRHQVTITSQTLELSLRTHHPAVTHTLNPNSIRSLPLLSCLTHPPTDSKPKCPPLTRQPLRCPPGEEEAQHRRSTHHHEPKRPSAGKPLGVSWSAPPPPHGRS
jgi:hypothetical protein